jgi:protein-tyrosine-phosphatase
MKNILIVCTANQTRSVIAMEIANMLAKSSGKAGEYRFSSAGVAFMGSEIDPVARRLLAEIGIETIHVSISVKDLDIGEYDEIHVMTPRHKTTLCSFYEGMSLEEKIRVLDIEDPYSKGMEEYHECLESLKDFYEKFING